MRQDARSGGLVSIPLEQGNVFRHVFEALSKENIKFQSLWNRAMSFDNVFADGRGFAGKSQSLWNRAMSFDSCSQVNWLTGDRSQSLWNRAMSFDEEYVNDTIWLIQVSIPLEQGNVFRQSVLMN